MGRKVAHINLQQQRQATAFALRLESTWHSVFPLPGQFMDFQAIVLERIEEYYIAGMGSTGGTRYARPGDVLRTTTSNRLLS